MFGKDEGVIMYTSDTCADCQAAKRFFNEHQIEVQYKNIAEDQIREELKSKYRRMAVPTIIIGDRVILGFAENKNEVMKLLKL
jgi:glutaredoxin 3